MQLKTLYPSGACKGTTKKGTPCGIRDIFENGFCRHHGGEGKQVRLELRRQTEAAKVERTLKRCRTFDRKIAKLAKRDPNLRALLERLKNGWKPTQA